VISKRHVVMFGAVAGIVLTAIGVADADGALGLLLTPGRMFNRATGFDGDPPEAGVVYGLTANCVVLALAMGGVAWVVLSGIRQLRIRTGTFISK